MEFEGEGAGVDPRLAKGVKVGEHMESEPIRSLWVEPLPTGEGQSPDCLKYG